MSWLSADDAAAHCRISIRTFHKWVAMGRLPPGGPPGAGHKRWRKEDLDAALSTKPTDTPSDPIMAAIDAAEKAAAARRADHRQGPDLLVREGARPQARAAAR